MNEQTFIETQEPSWKRLALLCDKADAALANLTAEEFKEFAVLYQKTCSDLATVQTRSANVMLEEFLNDLVFRSYSIIYRSKRDRIQDLIVGALVTAAQTARRRASYLALSATIFLLSAFFSYGAMEFYPQTRQVFIPPEMEANTDAWKKGLPARTGEQSVMATGMYASHNPYVAVAASSLSVASFGVGTLFLLYQNGSMVGALAHEMAGVGKLTFLIISLLPHGVTEISGIIFSGAAGFCLAWAVIAPGRYSRFESVARAGKDAIVLLFTAVIMMFLAAPVEGFFSFNPNIPLAVKALFALTMALAWAAFWIGFGREAEGGKPWLRRVGRSSGQPVL